MGTNSINGWEMIQQGVKDTEHLIGRKNYNMAMVKARQTLEYMVKLLAERDGTDCGGDLKAQIDALYQDRQISKATCEHYHKIRIIGNKAVHEGNNNAYDANQAYQLLSQEIYTFANDYGVAQHSSRQEPGGSRQAQGSIRQVPGGSRQAQGSIRKVPGGSRQAQGSIRQVPAGSRQAQAKSRQAQGPRRPSSASSNRSRRRQPQRRSGITLYDLLKLLVPVLCVILLFFVVKLVKPHKEETQTTEATTAVTTAATTAAPETETTAVPEPETSAPAVYKTTAVLNVRPQPNTTDTRIGQLDAGVTVEYVRAHNEEWAVIMFNGQEAYVASQYLTAE